MYDEPSPAELHPEALAWGYLYVVYGMLFLMGMYASFTWDILVAAPFALVLSFLGASLSRWFRDTMRKIED